MSTAVVEMLLCLRLSSSLLSLLPQQNCQVGQQYLYLIIFNPMMVYQEKEETE